MFKLVTPKKIIGKHGENFCQLALQEKFEPSELGLVQFQSITGRQQLWQGILLGTVQGPPTLYVDATLVVPLNSYEPTILNV